jgi:rootletin
MDSVSINLKMFVVQKLQERCEVQGRNLASLEERCASLKSTIDQLNLALERANTGETEMRAEIQSLQRTLLDTSSTSQSSSEKLKQVSYGFCDLKDFTMLIAGCLMPL